MKLTFRTLAKTLRICVKYLDAGKIRRFIYTKLRIIRNHYQYAGLMGVIRVILALVLRSAARLYSRIGLNHRWCPCCGWRGRNFLPYISGGYVTFYACCPLCLCHARHRGHRIFYDRQFKLMKRRGRMLYFAPEQPIYDYFKSNPNLEINTSEYENNKADYRLDIMNMSFSDNTWDYIVCHRVIEHIPDDRKGLRELYRILKPGGTLILSVPIYRENTIDYGKPNPLEDMHFYDYGLDFVDRIPKGFKVTCYKFTELFSPKEFKELSLWEDYLFLCEKSVDVCNN